MKQKPLVILLFLFGIMGVTQAQQNMSTAWVDQITYRLYIENKWDSLILIGKQAQKEGISFYYLHNRLGLAWEAKGNYRKAADEFAHSLSFSSSDPFAVSHRSLCQKWAGMKGFARKTASNLSKENYSLYGFRENLIQEFDLTTGVFFNNAAQIASATDLDGEAKEYGTTDFSTGGKMILGDLIINVMPWMDLQLGFTRFNIDKQQIFRYNLRDSIINYPLTQNDIYLSGGIYLAKTLEFRPAFHYLSVDFTPRKPDIISGVYIFEPINQVYKNWAISTEMVWHKGLFTNRFNVAMSKINDKNQKQAGLHSTWYPAGNLNYSLGASVIAFSEDSLRLIYGLQASCKVWKFIWLSADILSGQLRNSSHDNAAIVYNLGEETDFKVSGRMYFTIGKNVVLNISATNWRCKELYSTFIVANNFQDSTFSYNKYLITGGLKWTF
ncbi:MAG: hypothetical protein Q7J34_04215 [Bacteroidales bacterium]|nr:hypothetical protein [Bacteroidales bacterium]